MLKQKLHLKRSNISFRTGQSLKISKGGRADPPFVFSDFLFVTALSYIITDIILRLPFNKLE